VTWIKAEENAGPVCREKGSNDSGKIKNAPIVSWNPGPFEVYQQGGMLQNQRGTKKKKKKEKKRKKGKGIVEKTFHLKEYQGTKEGSRGPLSLGGGRTENRRKRG